VVAENVYWLKSSENNTTKIITFIFYFLIRDKIEIDCHLTSSELNRNPTKIYQKANSGQLKLQADQLWKGLMPAGTPNNWFTKYT
jgi:hypothetical protein